MVQDGRRVERVARLIREELSALIISKLKDPRVAGVTVTDVRVTPDLSVARVYFAAGDEDADRAAEGLARAAPFLRREVGASLRLRRMPELRFQRDEALEHGHRVDSILKEIGGEDR